MKRLALLALLAIGCADPMDFPPGDASGDQQAVTGGPLVACPGGWQTANALTGDPHDQLGRQCFTCDFATAVTPDNGCMIKKGSYPGAVNDMFCIGPSTPSDACH